MPARGLEPLRHWAPEPKSGASTSSVHAGVYIAIQILQLGHHHFMVAIVVSRINPHLGHFTFLFIQNLLHIRALSNPPLKLAGFIVPFPAIEDVI